MSAAYVYVICYRDDLHKIGVSIHPPSRLANLRSEGWPHLRVVKMWLRPDGDAYDIEAEAHRILSHRRSDCRNAQERFAVSGDVACMAVAMAIKIVAPEESNEISPPLGRLKAMDFSQVPPASHRSGYVRLAKGEDPLELLVSMRRQGVHHDRVYFDRNLKGHTEGAGLFLKQLRAGDEAFVARRWDLTAEMASILTQKGVSLRVLP